MLAPPTSESVRAMIRDLGRGLLATMPDLVDCACVYFDLVNGEWTLTYQPEDEDTETVVEGEL